jgi:hypothetical protein
MSKQWWDESSAEFAHNFALASTGVHQSHEPEIRIEHVEQGVYRLGVDRESLALTAQDLLDVMEWGLLHARELSQQAAEASQVKHEYEDTRKYMEHHYLGGE